MFLTKSAEYAIRCMAQIALLPWEASISANDLYEDVEVPREYMSKILRKLSSAGLLIAEKGHGGGYKLASAPSTISFMKILNAIGYDFNPQSCAFGWGQCNAKNPCPVHDIFAKLNHNIFTWATNTTLADVSRCPDILSRIRKN